MEYILDPTIQFYHFNELENVRASLLNNENEIEIVDLGAGSSYVNTKTKKISKVANQQLSSAYQLQVIGRLLVLLEPNHSIELGASLGLSSFYLAKSSKRKVTSFEGNPAFIKLIKYQQKLLQVDNLEIIPGNFDNTLPAYLDRCKSIDVAFIDGNHRKDATIQYFELLLSKMSHKGILIFDDIYWSQGMMQAWETIKSNDRCVVSVDLYAMGIVFIDKNLIKENIVLKPKKWR